MVEDDPVRFVAPHWLWGLLIVPIFYALALIDENRRKAQFERFASAAVWPTIAPEVDFTARVKKARLWVLSAAFAILALARPQWGTHEETLHLTGLDIMVALDISNSMETEDVVPSRIKKARHLIHTISDS